MQTIDLEATGLREMNSALQAQAKDTNQTAWEIVNPRGAHAIAVGLDAPIDVAVRGSTGYYCAGMNKQATVRVDGSAGPGVAALGPTSVCSSAARSSDGLSPSEGASKTRYVTYCHSSPLERLRTMPRQRRN